MCGCHVCCHVLLLFFHHLLSRCLLHAFSSIAPLPPPLSCPHPPLPPPLSCPPPPPLLGSPLSFLFFALSDMSRDSSDEESEEEEDFSQVQFGSRYTTAARVCVFVCLCARVHPFLVCTAGSRLTVVYKHCSAEGLQRKAGYL